MKNQKKTTAKAKYDGFFADCKHKIVHIEERKMKKKEIKKKTVQKNTLQNNKYKMKKKLQKKTAIKKMWKAIN